MDTSFNAGFRPTPAAFAAHVMQRQDTNGDGSIDLSTEATGRFAEHLATADTDADGMVTTAELSAADFSPPRHRPHAPIDSATMSARLIANLDADGSGEIDLSSEGTDSRFAARLAAADADGSGTVSAAELAAQVDARGQQRSGPERAFGGRGSHRPQGGEGRDPASMAANLIERADTNGDGVASLEELTAAFQARATQFEVTPADEAATSVDSSSDVTTETEAETEFAVTETSTDA